MRGDFYSCLNILTPSRSNQKMPAPEHRPDKFGSRQPVPNYDELFKRPLLPPDPIDEGRRHKSDFFHRYRNVVWWAVIFLVLGLSAVAIAMLSYDGVFAESGCG